MKIKKLLFTTYLLFLVMDMVNAQDNANADVKPSGNFWGYVFGDYYYKTHSDSLGRAPVGSPYGVNSLNEKNQNLSYTNAFQIRRAYLGYDYKLDSTFSAQAVLANEMDVDGNGYNTTYLKYAWVKWSHIFKGSNLMIGQMPTSSFATPFGTEPLWGYRSVEKTLIDLHSTDPSTDMGVMLIGNLWQQNNIAKLLPATIGYNFMVGNGTGAKPETNRGKKIRGNLYLNTFQQKLTIGVYGDYNVIQPSLYTINNTTLKAYIDYKSDGFRIGAEVFEQINKNGDIYAVSYAKNAKVDTADGAQLGWSVFASARIIKGKLNCFLRMDMYNPDTKFNSNNLYLSSTVGGNMNSTTFFNQTFYLVGLDYTPISRIHIMPNLWYTQYTAMSGLTDAKGNAITGRAKSDYDIIPRVTFFFVFNSSKTMTNNGMDN